MSLPVIVAAVGKAVIKKKLADEAIKIITPKDPNRRGSTSHLTGAQQR